MARRLYTVYGICSEGHWQDLVKHVFEPYFQYETIKYRYYHNLGVVKILLDSVVADIATVMSAAVTLLSREHWIREAIGFGLCVGFVGAILRREGVPGVVEG